MSILKTKNNALDLLKSDHKKVKDLFEEFEDSNDGRKKRAIVNQIIKELSIHAVIEEEIFYPAARKELPDSPLLNEAKEEHKVAKTLLTSIKALSPSDPDYDAKVTVLIESVRHHIKEEENELFKEVKETDLDLGALGEQLEQRKASLESNGDNLDNAEANSPVQPYQSENN